MGIKSADLNNVHFADLVHALRDADDVGVLLRGHLWIEALLEYATRVKLERPDAIDWTNARFEHKLALAEATGAAEVPLARAVKSFNRLRNKSAHEMMFSIELDQVKTLVGLTDDGMRKAIQRIADEQLDVVRQLEVYEAEGVEVEIDPAAVPYLRVLTPTRALLFGFVVCAVRSLALAGALEVAFRGRPVSVPGLKTAPPVRRS
ncbi:hypothetical protein AKG07_16710 [Microbacterium sp. CGR1]|uniref:hypothetical protein n=1 Tax=Microbacterium sp. CGR1 TaxID=1696072 RepID=UPI00069E7722|nr:hypothetical protein [Microbacterium sp. CGR1]AKV87672.1 hypothetical protein AKG07_16710 [Microbacterium sp. CGR1]